MRPAEIKIATKNGNKRVFYYQLQVHPKVSLWCFTMNTPSESIIYDL